MKRILLLISLALLAIACSQRPTTNALAPETYRGLLPAADCSGIDYTLTLNDSIAGKDTLFSLRMVYIEGDNAGGDIVFDSRGRQQQIATTSKRGYRLLPDDGDIATYLVVVNDTTLRLCDSTLNAIESPFNYDLTRARQ